MSQDFSVVVLKKNEEGVLRLHDYLHQTPVMIAPPYFFHVPVTYAVRC